METELENLEQHKSDRACRRRKQGKEYKLRVIHGSGGMLELVEVEPRRHWLHEWARIGEISGWGL